MSVSVSTIRDEYLNKLRYFIENFERITDEIDRIDIFEIFLENFIESFSQITPDNSDLISGVNRSDVINDLKNTFHSYVWNDDIGEPVIIDTFELSMYQILLLVLVKIDDTSPEVEKEDLTERIQKLKHIIHIWIQHNHVRYERGGLEVIPYEEFNRDYIMLDRVYNSTWINDV